MFASQYWYIRLSLKTHIGATPIIRAVFNNNNNIIINSNDYSHNTLLLYYTFLYNKVDPFLRHLDPRDLFCTKTVYSKASLGRGIPLPGAPIAREAAGPSKNSSVTYKAVKNDTLLILILILMGQPYS